METLKIPKRYEGLIVIFLTISLIFPFFLGTRVGKLFVKNDDILIQDYIKNTNDCPYISADEVKDPDDIVNRYKWQTIIIADAKVSSILYSSTNDIDKVTVETSNAEYTTFFVKGTDLAKYKVDVNEYITFKVNITGNRPITEWHDPNQFFETWLDDQPVEILWRKGLIRQ